MVGEQKTQMFAELEQAKAELLLLYEISNAMRTTLDLDQILYIILTAVTCHEGLGFNRAMLFLINKKENCLDGKIGIGPDTGEEAEIIWSGIMENRVALEDLLNSYDRFRRNPDSRLHNTVKGMRIPLVENQGVLALAALEGMPIHVASDETLEQVRDKYLETLGARYFVVVPMKAKDRVSGVIYADNKFTGKPITNNDVHILSLFANHAGLAIENSRLYEETVHLSNTDWLTKLWNHGYFQSLIDGEIAKNRGTDSETTLMMIDIDDFKNYNDRIGHIAGDKVIKKMAAVLNDASRKKDLVCRYGGEEFAVILPQTSKKDAWHIAERLREKIVAEQFESQEIQPKNHFTVSIGIATSPQDAADKQALIDHADKALYRAKRSGKDQIRIHGED